jgi:hypothetical protein
MEIPELNETFCINTNSGYFDKIIYALDYILSNEIPELKVISSKNTVLSLMNRCDRRRTRRDRQKKTKKTEFKYYFCLGKIFSDSENVEILFQFKEKFYKISLINVTKEPLGCEHGVQYPLEIKIEFENRNDITEILNYGNKIYCENYLDDDLEDYNTVTMFVYDENFWENNGKKKKRSIDSIYIPKKLKNDLVEEFERFESKEYISRLTKLGITRKKVLMLEGPPGTGKSSLIMALASKLERDIAYFSFTPEITDTKLIKSMQNAPNDSIIVLEDIDCLFEERKVNDTSKNSVTFSALLNCLDGLICRDGMIVITTTNHIDKLDPALIRSGRVDKVVSLTFMKKNEIYEMWIKFMENDYVEESEKTFYELVKKLDINITPSLLQQYLFKYLDQRQEALDNYEEIKDMHDKVVKSNKALYS